VIKISSSGSRGISVIALIFGIAGLGLGAYQIFFSPASSIQTDSKIAGIWFSEGNIFNVPEDSVTVIPNLLIDFTTESGEDAFFLYSGIARVNSTPGSIDWLTLQFAFRLNDDTPPGAFTNLQIPDVNSENFSIPISFHYTLLDFTAGSHNLTVSIYSDSESATVYYSRLLVQTFNS
jgi:hypothetical protein